MLFKLQLEKREAEVNAALVTLLDAHDAPPRLKAAMKHAVLGGGKRLRPFLMLETAAIFGDFDAMPSALALELIHCYSLVHDDLPAMDNDDLRRGLPTVHKAYDEATAILAGDALLTLAFEICDPRLVKALAKAANQMVAGQMLDLAAEGRFSTLSPLTIAEIKHLQAMKTGALLKFAVEAGAILANTHDDALSLYGELIGFAFQIADDLLDFEGDASVVGKAVGKDAALGKATLVSLIGVEAAKNELKNIIEQAIKAVSKYKADNLVEAAIYIAFRKK
jgi:farnesyl diphosphate synthase